MPYVVLSVCVVVFAQVRQLESDYVHRFGRLPYARRAQQNLSRLKPLEEEEDDNEEEGQQKNQKNKW